MIPAACHRLLVLTISPPENDCGCRVVFYRHLEERKAFDYIVATREKWAVNRKPDLTLRLPYILHRLEKSRFGPLLSRWLVDYENLVWPFSAKPELDRAIQAFRPHAILNLADPSLSPIALRAAQRHRLPLIGMFNDWFPIMQAHFGHRWTCGLLSRRYRRFYQQCNLAFCTSDGMQQVLGPHPNSHVIYPMPGRHHEPAEVWPPKTGKFRLVYVGSARDFYGRMLCALLRAAAQFPDFELKIVTPSHDWPDEDFAAANAGGSYLGFMPPAEAAKVMAGADALLVLMSFEREHELFMRTSFTTKFLDYTAFGKPIILWGPDYCTPAAVVRQHGGALHVNKPDAASVWSACAGPVSLPARRGQLVEQATRLHHTLFNPDRLQGVFEREIEKLTGNIPDMGPDCPIK